MGYREDQQGALRSSGSILASCHRPRPAAGPVDGLGGCWEPSLHHLPAQREGPGSTTGYCLVSGWPPARMSAFHTSQESREGPLCCALTVLVAREPTFLSREEVPGEVRSGVQLGSSWGQAPSCGGNRAHWREERETLRKYRALAHTIVRAGRSAILKTGWQARNSRKGRCCSSSPDSLETEFLPFQGTSGFSLKASTDWTGAPTLWRVICFTQSPLIKRLITSKKIPSRQHLDQCLTKHLGTIAKPSWHTPNQPSFRANQFLILLNLMSPIWCLSFHSFQIWGKMRKGFGNDQAE